MPSTFTDRLNGTTTSVAIKAPCRVATTANIALSGLQTVDGVALAEGDRVLVRSQTNAVNNGIYTASSTAWTRTPDFDGSLDVVRGTLVGVHSGTTQATTYWRVTTADPVIIDSSSITFEAGLASDALALASGYVTPEMFGAVGDPGQAYANNDQAAFQDAVDYCKTNGIQRILLLQAHYTLWALERLNPTNLTGWDQTTDGFPLIIPYDQRIEIVGLPGKTRLTLRDITGNTFDGTTPGTNFQVVPGTPDSVFRGCMFYLGTSLTDPGEDTRGRLIIRNLILDGQAGRTADQTQPADPTTGMGYDWTHQVVHVQPGGGTTYGGSLEVYNCESVSWRSEHLYGSNSVNEENIVRNWTMRDGNGNGFNPNQSRVDVDGLIIDDVWQAFEFATGENGRFTNVFLNNCQQAWVQGGAFGVPHTTATRVTADRLPMGVLDLTCRKMDNLYLGSWLSGTVRAIDARVVFGNASASPSGSFETNLNIELETDQTNDALVVITGGTGVATDKFTDRLNLRINHTRTAYAIANGKNPNALVQFSGSLGPNIRIHLTGTPGTLSPYATATLHDYAPMFTGDIHYLGSSTSPIQNVETTATITLLDPVIRLTTTNAGTFSANMPAAAKVTRGQQMLVGNFTSNATVQFNGNNPGTSNVRHAGFVVVAPGATQRFEHDGTWWRPISAVSPAKGVHVHSGNTVTMGMHERNAVARFTNDGGAITYTLPPNSTLRLGIGDGGEVQHEGTSTLTFAAGAGVTIEVPPGKTLATLGTGSTVLWRYVATDTYRLWGDLA